MRPVIVVVDNDNAFRDLLTEILGEEGYTVVTATTEADALPTIRRARPVLVILDMRMETPDAGLRIIEAVRRNPLTSTLPVLLCSADLAGMRQHAARLEALNTPTLAKPFDLGTLLSVVQGLVSPPGATDARGA